MLNKAFNILILKSHVPFMKNDDTLGYLCIRKQKFNKLLKGSQSRGSSLVHCLGGNSPFNLM